MKSSATKTCAICGKQFTAHHIVSGELVRKEIADEILKTHPD